MCAAREVLVAFLSSLEPRAQRGHKQVLLITRSFRAKKKTNSADMITRDWSGRKLPGAKESCKDPR
jgi:hypothetical protein